MNRGMITKSTLCVGAALCSLALLVTPARCAEGGRADLYLGVDGRGSARVQLWLSFTPPPGIPWEAALGRALGGTIREVEETEDDEGWRLRARCDTAFRRHGLLVQGQLSPAPLMDRLRPSGVRWLSLRIRHWRAGYSQCTGASRREEESRLVTSYRQWLAVGPDAPPVRLEFGYRPEDLLREAVPLVLLLLLPVLLTVRLHGTAGRIHEADPAVVWFGYWRWRRWLSTGTVWGWLAALWLLPVWKIGRYALAIPHAMMTVVPVLLGIALVPPLVVAAGCGLSLFPLVSQVRQTEWTFADAARQSAWSLAANLVPLLLSGAAIGAMMDDDARLAALWFAAGIASWSVLLRLWMRSMEFRLQALTTGDLRDRLFALAQKAGVKVQQLYVVPAGKSRLANAFAMQGNKVLLTDYLLRHLDRREVDGILAHELTHLRRGDPRRLGRTLALSIVIPITAYALLASFSSAELWRPILPLLLAVGLLINTFVRRRFEGAADAGAVALTGDPEAVIRGLIRITRLNQMPLQWGKWDERVLTHPSTLRRVQAIASRNGLSSERLEEILRSPESDGERYSLPPALVDEQRVFSTSYKSRMLVRAGWVLTAVILLTPALAAEVTALAGVEGMAKLAAYLAGAAATAALFLVAGNYLFARDWVRLERRLRAKLEGPESAPEAANGSFVGFSPDASPRLYEGFYDWDLGILYLGDDRLCYLGEQTRFALRREQVTAIRLGPGGPGWWSAPRLFITWRDEERRAGGTFNLRPGGRRSMRQLGREAQALAKRLQAWRDQPSSAPALPLALTLLEPQSLGEVTSLSPRAALNGLTFRRSLLRLMLLAAGVSLILGLPFAPEQGAAAWYVIGVSALAAVFQWWPYFRYREAASNGKPSLPRASEA